MDVSHVQNLKENNMAKLTQKEILEKAKSIIGDRTDDDALSFLEDISDTISDSGDDDWKSKYEAEVEAKKQLDLDWRKKYSDRFFATDSTNKDETNPANIDKGKEKTEEEIKEEKIEEAKKVTFDDLFKGEEN